LVHQYVHLNGQWNGQLGISDKKSSSHRTHSQTLHNKEFTAVKSMHSKPCFPSLTMLKTSTPMAHEISGMVTSFSQKATESPWLSMAFNQQLSLTF
jgi:hypothetical protein